VANGPNIFQMLLVYLIGLLISSVTVKVRFKVRVSCRIRVRFNNSHLSRKSRTASYLAMRHIWRDTGSNISTLGEGVRGSWESAKGAAVSGKFFLS